MYLQPLVKADLSVAGYLIGDTDAAVCAVVDPRLDMIDDILERAAAKGMRITAVIESHVHADRRCFQAKKRRIQSSNSGRSDRKAQTATGTPQGQGVALGVPRATATKGE